MRLEIDKKLHFDKEFIEYLVDYLKFFISTLASEANLIEFKKEFNIDTNRLLDIIINNFVITETTTMYIIMSNKYRLYKNRSINYWIKLLNYGSRSIKGSSLFSLSINYVNENLETIYKEWRGD